MSRSPARRFLALSSDAIYVADPPRELPEVADELHVVDAIRDASALRDEPEAIGGAILDSYGRDAWYFQSVRHAAVVQTARERRLLMTVDQRLADALARSKAQHRTDLRGDLLALEKAVRRARLAQPCRLVERDDGFLGAEPAPLVLNAAALERLERVEALLDHAADLTMAA